MTRSVARFLCDRESFLYRESVWEYCVIRSSCRLWMSESYIWHTCRGNDQVWWSIVHVCAVAVRLTQCQLDCPLLCYAMIMPLSYSSATALAWLSDDTTCANNYYLRRGGAVWVPVCLSVCLSVCPWTELCEMFSSDFYETLWDYGNLVHRPKVS